MKDGGAAFPRPAALDAAGIVTPGQAGQSLRDWFASQALAASIRQAASPEAIAQLAYQYADALLAERSKL